MRIVIAAGSGAGAELGERLARSGHEVVIAPGTIAGASADVVLVAAPASQAEAAIESAARPGGRDPFVVAIVSDARAARVPAASEALVEARPRVTLGELNHEASARVVRLALALQQAGVEAEVSLDIHSAIVRLRSPEEPHDGSAGGDDGSEACRRC